MKKNSILFLNLHYGRGKDASARLLCELAEGFVADGWDTRVITTGRKAGICTQNGVQLTILPDHKENRLFNDLILGMNFLRAAMRAPKSDIVVTLSDPPFLPMVGRIFAKTKDARHLHWCQKVTPDFLPYQDNSYPGAMMRILKYISARYMRTSTRIVATGRCMAAYLNKSEIDKSKIVVIPNWADAPAEKPDVQTGGNAPLADGSTKLRVNLEPRFRVFYVGPINKVYPVRTILDAAGILQLSNPEIEFTFIGNGIGYEKLAIERTRRRLENIKLLPAQPPHKLQEILAGGDLHLISMKDNLEGLIVPSRIYAALAAERPCIFIGPAQSEAASIINEYGAGAICAQGDAKSLADAVLSFRMDGTKWFEAHKGAKTANQNFAQEKSVRTWINQAYASMK